MERSVSIGFFLLQLLVTDSVENIWFWGLFRLILNRIIHHQPSTRVAESPRWLIQTERFEADCGQKVQNNSIPDNVWDEHTSTGSCITINYSAYKRYICVMKTKDDTMQWQMSSNDEKDFTNIKFRKKNKRIMSSIRWTVIHIIRDKRKFLCLENAVRSL